ncbi:MAG: hypothetical protein ACRBBQ_17770 [Cognatishimia sp.]
MKRPWLSTTHLDEKGNFQRMLQIFVYSLFAALIIALTTHLQADARWWKGPLASILLFIGGFLVAILLLPDTDNPALILASGAWISSILVGIGSAIALIFRRFVKHGKLVKRTFGAIWICSFLGLSTSSLMQITV